MEELSGSVSRDVRHSVKFRPRRLVAEGEGVCWKTAVLFPLRLVDTH